MRACFRSSFDRSASQIPRSTRAGIHSCRRETPGPATLRPSPSVLSSYLFQESALCLFHRPRVAWPQAFDVSAARYLRARVALDSVSAAHATLRCARECSCRRHGSLQHREARRCPRYRARSRKFSRIRSWTTLVDQSTANFNTTAFWSAAATCPLPLPRWARVRTRSLRYSLGGLTRWPELFLILVRSKR